MSQIEFSSDTGKFRMGWSFDGDYHINLEVKAQGFRGHSDGHVQKNDFEMFARDLMALSETRVGKAEFQSAMPNMFECSVRAIDSSGHLAAFGTLTFQSSSERAGEQKLEFSLEFEPSQIELAAKICQDIGT
jgi:hypothetical protein